MSIFGEHCRGIVTELVLRRNVLQVVMIDCITVSYLEGERERERERGERERERGRERERERNV